MEFDSARAAPLISLVLNGGWTAGNVGPPGQETHGPPKPIRAWRVAGQNRQRKATSSYLANTKFLAQPTEFEESGFCNSRFITKHLTKELISFTKKLDLENLNRRVEHQEQVLTAQQEKLRRQQEIINALVTYSMGEHVFRHLKLIYHSQMKHPGSVPDYKFQRHGPMPQEIRFLVDHGYIELNCSTQTHLKTNRT